MNKKVLFRGKLGKNADNDDEPMSDFVYPGILHTWVVKDSRYVYGIIERTGDNAEGMVVTVPIDNIRVIQIP